MTLVKKEDVKQKDPSAYHHGYHTGFIDAAKVLVVVFENGEFYYYSAVDFGLTKVPVQIETISFICPEIYKVRDPYFIVCENYYLLETLNIDHGNGVSLGTPIACLSHDASKYYDPRCKNIYNANNQENEKFQLLIHVNPTINKLYEFICSFGITYYISPDVEQASVFECRKFMEKNAKALNNLHESLKRTSEAIENENHFTGPQLTLKRGLGITTMY